MHTSDIGSRLLQLTFLGSCKRSLSVCQFFFPSVMYQVSLFPSRTILHKPELSTAGADPGFFLGGGAPLRNGVTNTDKSHIFFQNSSCVRKPLVISGRRGGGGAQPLHPPPRSAPAQSAKRQG